MKELFSSYTMARRYLFADKINFMLAMVPVLIGIAVYVLLGGWVFQSVIPMGEEWVSSYFVNDTLGDIFYYMIVGLMTVFIYLLVSWTMVLIISLIASPFNDLISARIERKVRGKNPEDISKGFAGLIGKLFKTLFNEIKKVIMIIFLTLIAFALNLLPILVPVAFIMTAILFAIQFVDYSWSRHDMHSKECFRDARKNWIPYAISGSGFLLIATIPIVNLFLPSYATSYYTVLWTRLTDQKEILDSSDQSVIS